MNNIIIEHGIPVPPRKHAQYGSWIKMLAPLKRGDSFLITEGIPVAIGPHLAYAGQKLSAKFVARTVKRGIRIWRTS